MDDLTIGNVDWLIEYDPDFYRTFLDVASTLVISAVDDPRRIATLGTLPNMIATYNDYAKKNNKPVIDVGNPALQLSFLSDVVTYIFQTRSR